MSQITVQKMLTSAAAIVDVIYDNGSNGTGGEDTIRNVQKYWEHSQLIC